MLVSLDGYEQPGGEIPHSSCTRFSSSSRPALKRGPHSPGPSGAEEATETGAQSEARRPGTSFTTCYALSRILHSLLGSASLGASLLGQPVFQLPRPSSCSVPAPTHHSQPGRADSACRVQQHPQASVARSATTRASLRISLSASSPVPASPVQLGCLPETR